MIPRCPRSECLSRRLSPSQTSRHGHFVRKSDSKIVQRFFCNQCNRSFSFATQSACFKQHKRRHNHLVYKHLSCGNSLRRTAKMLGLNQKTVARKFKFLAGQFRSLRLAFLESNRAILERHKSIIDVQFDEMESSIHSKCLPVTIPLAVDATSRRVLDFQVRSIPAKGKLAKISREKYGLREDRSEEGLAAMFENLKLLVHPKAQFSSDQKVTYPRLLKQAFPNATHVAHKGRRGCVVGQAELKRGGFDPLFSLNHTAAMIRYGVSRLARRTWCTSKTIQGLMDHLEIYVHFHNTRLI